MRRAAILGLVSFSVALAVPAQGPATASRHIVVNAAGPTVPHSNMPLMTICAGRANEGLRADWQQQLSTLQSEIGFRYLRFHGLLHDDMGVYTEDAKGRPSFNFHNIDVLYDAMLERHIRPFVELSFMPAKLASGTRTVFWWKANVSPPKDTSKWSSLIRALMQHWRERYGQDEISQWYYEVWNEPDLPVFWSGTEQQYFDLYRATADAIKQECTTCRVGGPASAIRGLEGRWLSYVTTNHAPADFLSTHAYGVSGTVIAEDGTSKTLNGDPIDRVRETHELLQKSGNGKMELYYTEWSIRYTPNNPIHDQYIAAAFLVDRLHAAVGLTDSLAYWTFTDIFEENGPRFPPFSGAFGLISRDGVRKPAFFAYKFLSQLGQQDLISNDRQSWITRKPDGSVQALIWDYTALVVPPADTDERFYGREQKAVHAGTASLRVTGLDDGPYLMKKYAVGYEKSDAYTAYLHMGSPQQLTRAQLLQLNRATDGAPVQTKMVQVTHGSFEDVVELQQNEVVSVNAG